MSPFYSLSLSSFCQCVLRKQQQSLKGWPTFASVFLYYVCVLLSLTNRTLRNVTGNADNMLYTVCVHAQICKDSTYSTVNNWPSMENILHWTDETKWYVYRGKCNLSPGYFLGQKQTVNHFLFISLLGGYLSSTQGYFSHGRCGLCISPLCLHWFPLIIQTHAG